MPAELLPDGLERTHDDAQAPQRRHDRDARERGPGDVPGDRGTDRGQIEGSRIRRVDGGGGSRENRSGGQAAEPLGTSLHDVFSFS